jgi:hypothetical protein
MSQQKASGFHYCTYLYFAILSGSATACPPKNAHLEATTQCSFETGEFLETHAPTHLLLYIPWDFNHGMIDMFKYVQMEPTLKPPKTNIKPEVLELICFGFVRKWGTPISTGVSSFAH